MIKTAILINTTQRREWWQISMKTKHFGTIGYNLVMDYRPKQVIYLMNEAIFAVKYQDTASVTSPWKYEK